MTNRHWTIKVIYHFKAMYLNNFARQRLSIQFLWINVYCATEGFQNYCYEKWCHIRSPLCHVSYLTIYTLYDCNKINRKIVLFVTKYTITLAFVLSFDIILFEDWCKSVIIRVHCVTTKCHLTLVIDTSTCYKNVNQLQMKNNWPQLVS